MKKRKPPIILITVVVFLALGAFAFNYATNNGQDPKAQQAAQQQQQQAPPDQSKAQVAMGPARAATNPSSIAAQTKAELGKTTDAPPGGPARARGPGHRGMGPDQPSIAIPQASPGQQKPQPNDSSISGQWYTGETHASSH